MMTVLEYPVRTSSGQDSELKKAAAPADFRFIDPMVDPTWDKLVLSHPEATLFHSSAWAKVLARTYGHEPFYLQAARRGITEALIPLMEVSSLFTGRRGVCLPFSDFCGPLLFGHADTAAVFEKLASLSRERNWSYVQVREQLPAVSAAEFYGHTLDLRPGGEALFARFSSPVRRAIRKAEKSGLTVERSDSWTSVRDFYQLHVETRRRHGLPPQPQSFFRNIFREVIEPGYGLVIRAFLKSRCVAAAIFFQFGATAIYKFGASALALQAFRGNNLVMWEGIRLLAQSEAKALHFGRTSLSNQNLRRFKLGWGAEEQIIKYCQRNTSSGQWIAGPKQTSERRSAIFSRMPLALNRLAGALLYPHLD